MTLIPTTRLIVLGTGDFALPMFESLCESGHHVLALITQPDRPQGRKQELVPSQIKQAALKRGLPVIQPEDVNSAESREIVQSLGPELLITAAYGQILSPALLSIPRLGGINLHGSILPAFRGAAPVARAIENGETETGVTVIQMTPRIDAGGMISFAKTPIEPDETAGELEFRLARLGAPLIMEAVRNIAEGTSTPILQDRSRVTRAPKLSKTDGRIDWTRPAQAIHNLVRAMQPWPQAETTWSASGDADRAPSRLIIQRTSLQPDATDPLPNVSPGTVIEATGQCLAVMTGDVPIRLQVIQVPGKKALPVKEFLRGSRVQPGDHLGQ